MGPWEFCPDLFNHQAGTQGAKGNKHEPLLLSAAPHFRTLQKVLLQARALHLPDGNRPFTLYVHENKEQGLGVLGQMYGPTFALVAYLSKQLDPTVRGWAPFLRTLAASYVLLKESQNLLSRVKMMLCKMALSHVNLGIS
uniref:Reverse transcriptase/retrotransposon-derived protein RNase H-like domain-containing protein n=1 Tax=Spermophilus dauricus TaxID=99837 RepID=A0A8C9QUY9_SPEDA